VHRYLQIPGLTSFLATGTFSGQASYLPGVDDLQALDSQRYAKTYGPHQDYRPELVVHLRPTSPARRSGLIADAVATLRANPSASSVRSVRGCQEAT